MNPNRIYELIKIIICYSKINSKDEVKFKMIYNFMVFKKLLLLTE